MVANCTAPHDLEDKIAANFEFGLRQRPVQSVRGRQSMRRLRY